MKPGEQPQEQPHFCDQRTVQNGMAPIATSAAGTAICL